MKTLRVLILLALAPLAHLAASTCGNLEVAPAYIHLDVLDNKKTLTRFDLPALKVSGLGLVPGTGISIKPSILYGKNGAEFFTASIGLGHCVPIGEKLILTPSVGYVYTRFNSDVPRPTPLGTLQFNEKLRSTAPYLSLEATYLTTECLRFYLQYQYTWSHSRTKFGFFNPLTQTKERGVSKGKAGGPTVGAMIEYDLNSCWSVNLGAAYNASLNKEKLGLRGYGVKTGIVRWF